IAHLAEDWYKRTRFKNMILQHIESDRIELEQAKLSEVSDESNCAAYTAKDYYEKSTEEQESNFMKIQERSEIISEKNFEKRNNECESQYPNYTALHKAKSIFLHLITAFPDLMTRKSFFQWLDSKLIETKTFNSDDYTPPKKTKLDNSDGMIKYSYKDVPSEAEEHKIIRPRLHTADMFQNTPSFNENEFYSNTDDEGDIIEEKLVVDESLEYSAATKLKETVDMKNTKRRRSVNLIQSKQEFICQDCSKSFANRSTLKRHQMLHIGIRYNCPDCMRSFSRQDYLKVHQKRCSLANIRIYDEKESNIKQNVCIERNKKNLKLKNIQQEDIPKVINENDCEKTNETKHTDEI
ncbi:MAG: hypothetical protein MHPSP_000145, partial [Paramarteilia canceri]